MEQKGATKKSFFGNGREKGGRSKTLAATCYFEKGLRTDQGRACLMERLVLTHGFNKLLRTGDDYKPPKAKSFETAHARVGQQNVYQVGIYMSKIRKMFPESGTTFVVVSW